MPPCTSHSEIMDRLQSMDQDIKLLLQRSTKTQTQLYVASALGAWAISTTFTAFALLGK